MIELQIQIPKHILDLQIRYKLEEIEAAFAEELQLCADEIKAKTIKKLIEKKEEYEVGE